MNLPRYTDKDRQIIHSLISQLQLLDDYEAVIADHKRLVREIDVILNGENCAARQASLCDLVEEIRELRRVVSGYEEGESLQNEGLAPYEDVTPYPELESEDVADLELLNLEIARLAEEERAAMPEPISPQ